MNRGCVIRTSTPPPNPFSSENGARSAERTSTFFLVETIPCSSSEKKGGCNGFALQGKNRWNPFCAGVVPEIDATFAAAHVNERQSEGRGQPGTRAEERSGNQRENENNA